MCQTVGGLVGHGEEFGFYLKSNGETNEGYFRDVKHGLERQE